MFFKKWFKPRLKAKVYAKGEHRFDINQVDKNAINVLEQLVKKGCDAYIVGGAIRDQLAGIPSKDCDVATSVKPERVLKVLKKSLLIGRRFKIVHARFGRDIVEVSTFRSSANSRKRHIAESGLIKRDNVYGRIDEDVMRRDFTINALYYDYRSHAILDFVGGMEDLQHKRLVAIGDPYERFPEDPVRMLRAIRFSAKLKLKMNQDIMAAVIEHKDLLKAISGQRLYIEVIKLYYAGSGYSAHKQLQETGLLAVLMPEVKKIKHPETAYALWENMAKNADKRYKEGRRLSVVYLFACLYWPVFIGLMAKKRYRHFNSDVANEVLLNGVFDIPIKARENIVDIWQNQYLFKGRERMQNKVMKSKRLRASYELLCQRAFLDPSLSDLALYWSEYVNE